MDLTATELFAYPDLRFTLGLPCEN